MRKLMITPFFGELPPWMDKFKENYKQTLAKQGYDWLFTQDLDDFNRRCQEKLGFKSPVVPGTGKVWDYRCCFGLLYEEELKGYQYWGHMDFDVVFGNVSEWFPDAEIQSVDLWSNHHSYVNGCFSLYRNIRQVNELFMQFPGWVMFLKNHHAMGWVETDYSRTLEDSDLRYKYSFNQGWPYTTSPNLSFEDGRLYQDGEEIAMFHFRRSKHKGWPL